MMSKCKLELKFQGTFRNVKKHCGIQAEVQSPAAGIEQTPTPVEAGKWLTNSPAPLRVMVIAMLQDSQ